MSFVSILCLKVPKVQRPYRVWHIYLCSQMFTVPRGSHSTSPQQNGYLKFFRLLCYVTKVAHNDSRKNIIFFKISKCFSSGDLWKCRFCDNPFEPEYIATYVQSLEDELYAISKSDPTPQKLEAFLKGHFKDLHPKHFLNLIGKILIILNYI